MHFVKGQHIHIVGIGGSGMSAIARVLLQRGYVVSGSDRSTNPTTARLIEQGASVYLGHTAAHVADADMVIATSAVPDSHVELEAARARGIPVYRRRDILAPLMADHNVIAVAGTHGKTTTTSMIVHVLQTCGLDPGYIVGSTMHNTGTNADTGGGSVFVIEADEYDYMFHGLLPDVAVVTSLEHDHPDFFADLDTLKAAFATFIDLLQADGLLIACADDPQVIQLADASTHRTETYSLKPEAVWRAINTQIIDGMTTFDVLYHGQRQATARLALPGSHNVLNALGALAAAHSQGVSIADAAAALETFRSTARRFELRGAANDVLVIDDYAHHPTAIRLTLEAARTRYPDHTLWAVWQPHTYSRTQQFLKQYSSAFNAANHVLVTDIYAAREDPLEGVSGRTTAQAIQHAAVEYSGTLENTAVLLRERVRPPAVILVMSAGDATRISTMYLNEVQDDHADQTA